MWSNLEGNMSQAFSTIMYLIKFTKNYFPVLRHDTKYTTSTQQLTRIEFTLLHGTKQKINNNKTKKLN